MGKYSVTFRGIDGTSTRRFASLKGVAKYVKERYLGADYVRGTDTLQGEFGYYSFKGFTWADLGKRLPTEDGYPEFHWFKEFGGDFDPDLDPTALGDYTICSVHPHWHPSIDCYVTGWSYKTLTRASTAAEARAKLDRLYEELGDGGPDEFSPYAVFFKGKQVYLPLGDEAVLGELDARLKGTYVPPLPPSDEPIPF